MTRRALTTAWTVIAATTGTVIAQAPDVATFVRTLHAEGVPYTDAAAYTDEDASILLAMLKDEAEVVHWANITTTLGAIGSAAAVDGMITFIEDEESAAGGMPASRYRAKTAAILALGYAANKKEPRALEYLIESTSEPDVWNRRIQWSSPIHSTDAERDDDLRSVAVLGLALSGAEEARSVLVKSNTAPGTSLVRDALRTLDAVAAEGLATYYSNAR